MQLVVRVAQRELHIMAQMQLQILVMVEVVVVSVVVGVGKVRRPSTGSSSWG